MKKQKTIIIVGAGPGGLVTAMLLTHFGFKVKIFEKEKIPGGRNGFIKLGDYKFDIGPTFFMMDGILREIFKITGRDLKDYLKLTKLSPMYKLYFDNEYINVFSESEKMKKELARVFPGEESGLDKFNIKEKKRLEKLFPILQSHNNNFFDAFGPKFLSALPYFSIGRTLYGVMGNYFKSNFAKLSFTFQSKYLGMSPWRCPGAFAMVPLVEHHDGVYHIEGGLSEINSIIASIIKKDGSEIFYNSKVKQIILENKKAIGVELENGEKHLADEVIVNADFSYMIRNLIDKNITKKFKRWSPKKLNKKNYSCSIFMIYLGINKKLDLDHHTIVFAKNYRKNVNDIFDYRLTDDDFSFYLRDTSKVDPGLAPKDKTALYILVPVPNNRSKIDWEKEKQKIRDKTLLLIEERLGKEILDSDIEVEKIITPLDWEKDYNVDLGAVFNLGHNLNQMLWFRPHNKFEELDNLYLVGGGTHPGSGLPTIYQSGKIVAELIKQKYS